MASYAPPTENLPHFNPIVFTVDTTPLTLAEASKLYFKKSGGIIYGAVSMPSLSLNGVNVENKLLEIDTANAKLTDISYSTNVTSILHDLSVNGVLKLNGLPNAGNEISSNKLKTTKISYDSGTSVTTIGDTLKATSTLIVGSQNYNASDEFQKLTNISKSGSILTVNDSINLTANLQLPNHSDVNNKLNYFDELLVDIEYDEINNITKIIRDFEVSGNFKLNTITDVEQKIIDLSNATIPYITYDSVDDELVVTKDVDLATNDLTCNFMRPIAGGNYGLSQNWSQSYLLFRNSGHHIDSFNTADDTGRDLYLNFYAESGVILGSHFNNSTTTINGNLKIIETTGTPAASSGGSLTLIHGDTNGSSSIVFKSDNNVNNDYGYISYKDDIDNAGGQKSLLEIGVQNDSVTSTIDNIAIMPSGYVGINTRTPQTMLDVNGDTKISGNLELNTITDVEQKIIDISNTATNLETNVTGISYDTVQDLTTIDNSLNVTGNLELGTITDVEQKIIDISNTATNLETNVTGISYDTVQDLTTIDNSLNVTGNLELGTITNVEQKIIDISNNSGGGGSIPSITYDAVTLTTTIDGSFVVIPQLTIRPEVDLQDAVQEIYSKNGTATLKLGDDDGTTTTFSNILKSENGNATFYGNNSGETKFMEYNSTDDKINISKDMDLRGVLLEERPYHNNSGIGLCLRTTLNPPDTTGGIFEVRSSGFASRLFCGQAVTSSGANPFYFGYSGNNGEEADSTKYTGKLDTDGLVECTGVTVNGVRFEERNYYPNNGDGISIRPTINPTDTSSSGSIFDVRSAGYACRLFVGNYLTSPVYNEFYFGPNEFMLSGEESDPLAYKSKLGTDGSVECTEIKVNYIPLNSFTNYSYDGSYNPGDWGQGTILTGLYNSQQISYSHSEQFTLDTSDYTITCNNTFYGTYEITAHVVYRNNAGNWRHNPCIGIAIGTDTNNSLTPTGPDWQLRAYSQSPFSAQYVRMSEGKVTSLNAKRIHHFSNSTEKVSIRTYIEVQNGSTFNDTSTTYTIMSADISFKYLGNFNSITT